jgi:hypothetical protein
MKLLLPILFLILSNIGFAQDCDKLIQMVGTFPEDYVGQTLTFDKVYGWFRLEKQSTDKSSGGLYKVTICNSNSDCFSKLGILCNKIIPVVNKKLAQQLVEKDLSSDDLKYICRLTAKVIGKKMRNFDYMLLISKIEIYSDSGKIIEVYQ